MLIQTLFLAHGRVSDTDALGPLAVHSRSEQCCAYELTGITEFIATDENQVGCWCTPNFINVRDVEHVLSLVSRSQTAFLYGGFFPAPIQKKKSGLATRDYVEPE